MEHESRANNPAFVLYRPATRPPALVFSHAAGGIAAGSQRLTLFPTIAQKTAREVEREGATPAVGRSTQFRREHRDCDERRDRPGQQSRPEAEASRRNFLHYKDARALSPQYLPSSAS